MYFLAHLEGIAGKGIIGVVETAARSICFSLSSFLYELMISLYDIFDLLCTSRLLNNDVLSAISSRIGLILGIVMFFYIVFSFIKMLIDPDSISNKETGAVSLIKKTLIVIVMFGSFNFVFDFLYGMQKLIIENNVISNFILPYQLESEDLDEFGTTLAYQLMFSFYVPNDFKSFDAELTKKDKDIIGGCDSLTKAFKNQVMSEGKFDLGYSCLDKYITVTNYYENTENDVYVIKYNYIFSLVSAVFVDYILLIYCFKIGVRMIQLLVLEVLAPVAIMSYLAPKKDTMFSKWLKIYFATYIDVFIRIGIINFVIFLLATIFQVEKNINFGFWGTMGDVGLGTKAIIEVIMILALLTFAKKAPDLLKELFPAGASKLGFGLSMKDIVLLQKGAKIGSSILGGAVGGAAMGAVGLLSGRGLGFATGALKGGLSGLKGQGFGKTMSAAWKDQNKLNKTIADVRRNGGSAFGYQLGQLQQKLYMQTAADRFDSEKADLEAENALYNQFASYFDKGKGRAKEKIETGDFELATFADNKHAYNAALDVFKQKQRIDLLKASAAKADNIVRDSNGFTELDRLNEQISNEMMVYNKNLDKAIYSYMDHNSDMEKAKDKVIAQQFSGAHQLKISNSELLGEMDITTAEQFKKSGDTSKGKIAENDEKLIENKSEGERARANKGK